MSYAAAAVGRLPIAISFLAIVGDHVSHSCKIIDTAKDFPQLDFTVPNDTTYWVWDDVMEQKYWKRLKKWKQMPLKVFVVPFSHVDAFWIQTFEEYYRTSTSHILDNLVRMMPRLPKMTFVWSDIAFLAYWWERASEKAQNTLKNLVVRGKLEIVTGGWVMPDEAITSLYALLTQLIEGHEWLYENLQVIPETSWSIDPFGLSSTMPYLLAASGVKGGLLVQRVHFAWQRLLGHLGHSDLMWRQSWDANSTHEMKLRVQHSCTYVLTDTCGPATPLCQLYDFAEQRHDIQFKDIRKKIEVLLGQYGRLGSLSRTNHVVVPLGGDFRFVNSSEWTRQYTNYRAIMDYVNHNFDLYNANIEFGTLKEFFSEVGIADLKVEGDFFPYSDYTQTCLRKCKLKSSYWTGYYTTRPRLKLLSNSVGAKLRAVEILFTLGALSWCRDGTLPDGSGRSWVEEAQRKLNWARRAWALFQHHDGITGTSTARVMKQQTRRLKRAGQYLKETLEGIVTRFLYSSNASCSSPTPRHRRSDENKEESGKSAKIVIYNSIELARNDLLAVIAPPNIGRVKIKEKGESLLHQIVERGHDTLIYFKTRVPPLSLKILELIEYEGEPKYSIRNQRPDCNGYDTLSNNLLTLYFDQGILVASKTKDYGSDINVKIGTYDTSAGYSGAYLFKPSPKIEYFTPSKDAEIKKGPVFGELRTGFDCCTLTIRLMNEDDNPVIHVIVEYLLQMDDKELFLEIDSGVKSSKWMTDMNDFELRERIQAENEGLEANVYPMTSITYLESDEERLVMISDHSHGVANPRQGVLQVMLDRRTTMDDGKGIGEPLRDNTKTVSKFWVVLYKFPNSTLDILGLSRRMSNPPLALTVRTEDGCDDKKESTPRSTPKDQCFPRECIFLGDWDIPRSYRGEWFRDRNTGYELSRAFKMDLLRNSGSKSGSGDGPEEHKKQRTEEEPEKPTTETKPRENNGLRLPEQTFRKQSTETPATNKILLPDQTFLLLQGNISDGIRILTLRTRQLSGESPGWALLVLHNTSNLTITPFPNETFFTHVQLSSIIETTLTGIQEIEPYAVLSDITMKPHTLKTVKLLFKTSGQSL